MKTQVRYDRIVSLLGDKLKNYNALASLDLLYERVLEFSERIDNCREMEGLFHAFNAGYIPAGPSGLPTRGHPEVLPTGKNFYTTDPFRIPSEAAWRVGRVLATSLLERYEREYGRLPENCGMVWFCSDLMWTEGEQFSQMLYLLGAAPVWEKGRVVDIEIIPLEELCRPRIDLTVRIGGIIRDSFPQSVELLDKAIRMVSELNEPPDMNFVRKHAFSAMKKGATWDEATTRIFGSKPGTYGAGVNLAVYASAWENEADLADIFIQWSGYAYGKSYGIEAYTQLSRQLETVNVTFKNNGTDEHDLLGCCCHFAYHGGLTAAAKHLSGEDVACYHGDTRDPESPRVVDISDEIQRVVRTKLLNPKWIYGMKQHGYSGAREISMRIGRVYGWDASTDKVDDWIFEELTNTYVLDKEMREWFEEQNPHALEEIARRLIEAAQRGVWKADPATLEQLKQAYLEIEGWMEEHSGEGEFQGGNIEVITPGDVENWAAKMKEIHSKRKGVK